MAIVVAADTRVSVNDCMVAVEREHDFQYLQHYTAVVREDTTVRQWCELRHICWRIAVIREDTIVEHLPHCMAKSKAMQVMHGIHFTDFIFSGKNACNGVCKYSENISTAKILHLPYHKGIGRRYVYPVNIVTV